MNRSSVSTHIRVMAMVLLPAISGAAFAQERVDGAIQNRGFFQQKIAPEEIGVHHDSEFKGAKKVAISVFNVAFPRENHYTAITEGNSFWARMGSSAKAYMDTEMTGLDQETRQRIADKAFALFVEQLKGAGYDVVEQAELIKLAPEYAKWDVLPNYSQGRFGTYVAPTGRGLYFLQGDSAKRDTSGTFGGFREFRALDRPQAFSRSPYIANAGNIGIIAVTLVVDYGVYSSSGQSRNLGGGASVGYKPGVTIAAGNISDSATLLEYWGPNSGGFPALAFLQQPIRSEKPFAMITGMEAQTEKSEGAAVRDIKLVADPLKFEAAADEVLAIALPKLVSVMKAAQ